MLGPLVANATLGPCATFQFAPLGPQDTFFISAFAVAMALLCLLGVAELSVYSMRAANEELFPMYLGYLLFTSFSFVVQALQRLLPQADAASRPQYAIAMQGVLGVNITMQWVVHVGTMLFLVSSAVGGF